MTNEFNEVDIWLGRFTSEGSVDAYFAEQYFEDDEPVSEFAKDQGESFIDHDFMERSYHSPPVTDLRQALQEHSFAASYIEQAVAAFSSRSVAAFDTLVLVWGGAVQSPSSVTSSVLRLQYLGRFRCAPDVPPYG